MQYAPPGVGIKAKQSMAATLRESKYAPPGFGIKAKLAESQFRRR